MQILISPNSFIYISFFLTLSRLYANSLFASLNARETMRSKLHVSNGNEIPLSFNSSPRELSLAGNLSSSRARDDNVTRNATMSNLYAPQDPKRTDINIDEEVVSACLLA
jgi:hypothetical protein